MSNAYIYGDKETTEKIVMEAAGDGQKGRVLIADMGRGIIITPGHSAVDDMRRKIEDCIVAELGCLPKGIEVEVERLLDKWKEKPRATLEELLVTSTSYEDPGHYSPKLVFADTIHPHRGKGHFFGKQDKTDKKSKVKTKKKMAKQSRKGNR